MLRSLVGSEMCIRDRRAASEHILVDFFSGGTRSLPYLLPSLQSIPLEVGLLIQLKGLGSARIFQGPTCGAAAKNKCVCAFSCSKTHRMAVLLPLSYAIQIIKLGENAKTILIQKHSNSSGNARIMVDDTVTRFYGLQCVSLLMYR